MSVRIVFPPPEGKQLGGVRVFHVDDAGQETEITEVGHIEIIADPGDIVRARIETFLAVRSDIRAEGTIVTLCPRCMEEVQCSKD